MPIQGMLEYTYVVKQIDSPGFISSSIQCPLDGINRKLCQVLECSWKGSLMKVMIN